MSLKEKLKNLYIPLVITSLASYPLYKMFLESQDSETTFENIICKIYGCGLLIGSFFGFRHITDKIWKMINIKKQRIEKGLEFMIDHYKYGNYDGAVKVMKSMREKYPKNDVIGSLYWLLVDKKTLNSNFPSKQIYDYMGFGNQIIVGKEMVRLLRKVTPKYKILGVMLEGEERNLKNREIILN